MKNKKLKWIIIVVMILACVIAIFRNTLLYNIEELLFEEVADKPIIYIHAPEGTTLDIQLSDPQKITCSYPEYTDGWNVTVEDNNTLIDHETGMKLYSLYYEADHVIIPEEVKEEGFLVRSEDAASFLEDKLEQMGLDYREREEFIIYWLPKLQENEYNHIYFAINQQIDTMGESLIVNGVDQYDSIRVWMIYEPSNKSAMYKEQDIIEPQFATDVQIVEWGGISL